MASLEQDLLLAFETHSVGDIQAILDAGLDPRVPIQGKPPIQWLTEMYLRSDSFPACLRLLLEQGTVIEDSAVVPVLLNDAEGLTAAVRADPLLLQHRTNLVSSFTPLIGATLLHVAAEYGHLDAARVLIQMGADVNARAAVNEQEFNGHTPLFHTVNSWKNRSQPILQLLLDAGARCDVRLPGLVWGQGFEWETTFFDVTPISYAQMGLLPQVTRDERDVYANIRLMLEASGRAVPPLENVPNRYLQPRAKT
ncbi:MAG: ankyrin repeat domain-containing protein [Terriglobales bacterium]